MVEILQDVDLISEHHAVLVGQLTLVNDLDGAFLTSQLVLTLMHSAESAYIITIRTVRK